MSEESSSLDRVREVRKHAPTLHAHHISQSDASSHRSARTIAGQQGLLALGQGHACVGGVDDRQLLVGVLNQPCPAGAELGERACGKLSRKSAPNCNRCTKYLVLEVLDTLEARDDSLLQRLRQGSTVRGLTTNN